MDTINSLSALLTKGACSQDKITSSSVSNPFGISTSIPVSIYGTYISVNYALTCQKTSDNNGYCGASTNESYVVSTFVIASFIPELKIPAITDMNASKEAKSICTECAKNGLANYLTNTNLSEQERSNAEKVSSDLDKFCGNSYTSVPGVGGLGDSSNAISGALSTAVILAAIFAQL
jgi:hypothetical protein